MYKHTIGVNIMDLLRELLSISLEEMVQRIPSLKLEKLENPRENKKLYKNISTFAKKTSLGNFNALELSQISKGRETEIYAIDRQREEVVYYMRYEIQQADFIDVDWVTQVLVWRGSNIHSEGIAKYVFYKYVLDKFGIVVSDTQQTSYGEKFWKDRVIEAFSNPHLRVYLIDFNTHQIKKLNEGLYKELLFTKNDPWGDASFHRGLRLCIADFDLTH